MSSSEIGRSYSLQRRLAWQLLLAIGLSLGALFVFLDVLVDRAIYAQFEQFLSARAEALAAYARPEQPEARLPDYELAGHAEFFARYDAHGHLRQASANSQGRALHLPAGRSHETATFVDLPLPDGHRGRAIVLPLMDGGWLVLASERESWDVTEWYVHLALLGGCLLAVALTLLLCFWLLERAFAPVQREGERLRQLPADALSSPPREPLPSELLPYTSAMQQALGKLAEAVARERRLSRNIAHELRTPLAEIRLLCENALQSGDSHDLQASLAATLDINAHMERRVQALLALARYESGQLAPARDPLDLAALVRHVCQHLPADGRSRVQLQLPDELWVHADPDMLECILGNLLHNACEYAPGHTPIHIDRCKEGNGHWLQLHNATEHLLAEHVRHFGEHYWRNPAHADGRHTSHTGLGLALSRAMAQALGLQLHFALNGQMLTARLGPLPLI